DLPVGFLQRVDDARRDAALQEEAASSGASLARGADGAEEDGAEDEVGIGVVHHDDAVVAAEFEDGAAEPAGDRLRDVTSHFGRAGEADERDARVVEDGFADGLTRADYEVEYAAEVMAIQHAIADLLNGDRGERRVGRWTPKHTIAADRGDH